MKLQKQNILQWEHDHAQYDTFVQRLTQRHRFLPREICHLDHATQQVEINDHLKWLKPKGLPSCSRTWYVHELISVPSSFITANRSVASNTPHWQTDLCTSLECEHIGQVIFACTSGAAWKGRWYGLHSTCLKKTKRLQIAPLETVNWNFRGLFIPSSAV